MKKIEVVAGIIKRENKILCMQRDKGKHEYVSYKWEFPGGKIEENETREQALIRELKEEMSIDIFSLKHFTDTEHIYPDLDVKMYCFLCETNAETPRLNVHKNFLWCEVENLKNLDWADADKPIVDKIIENLKN